MNEQSEFGGQPGDAAAPGYKKLIAYHIIERKGLERPIWSRIGTAFVNKDGSINVFLDQIPIDGKIQVREERQRTEWAPRPAPRRIDAEA